MAFQEPSSSEVRLTLALGQTLAVPFYRRYINSLPLKGSERVLDFGSGSGVCSRHLARRLNLGGRLTCVDVSTVWMQTIRHTLRRCANVEFRLGSMATLCLPDASYDAVFLHFVLHDVPFAERAEIVRHLARVLKPGGLLFIREPGERGGMPADEIRERMTANGLREIQAGSETHWYTGPVYAGVYRK